MLGDAGIGKSALLENLTGHARGGGLRVLSVAGRENEGGLAFAGLRRLLRPVLDELSGLPARQAQELRGALGLAGVTAEPDRFLASIALLGLLRQAGTTAVRRLGLTEPASGIFVVMDDAQWLDRASLDMLAFVAHRLNAEPVTLILAARGAAPPAGFDRGFAELLLDGLPVADANELLDAQPRPPRGRARAEILAQAAGNPLALIELTQRFAADPAAGQSLVTRSLPLACRLTAVIAAQLDALPAATRQALLLAAVADGENGVAVGGRVPGLDPGALAPAEEAGLITVDIRGVRFRHPLICGAVYREASFASRAAAHRQVADAVRDQPDRRAWHLAAARQAPDDQVAALLSASASQAQRRGGTAAAALVLERAADLTADPADRAGRLVAAALAAAPTGQTEWAQELATRGLTLTEDRHLRSHARLVLGWALTWSGQYTRAIRALLPLARETISYDPLTAWDAIAFTATAAYQSGDPESLAILADALARLSPPTDPGLQALRLWAMAVIGHHEPAAELLKQLSGIALGEHYLSRVGAAAWLLDQPRQAIALLNTARGLLTDREARMASGGSLDPLGWAYLDTGRWDDALNALTKTGEEASIHCADIASAGASLIKAMITAARGDGNQARNHVAAALAADQEQSRLVTARARHALGLAALADGDYLIAFGSLRPLFGDDGTPFHYHVSYLAVADLAVAAARIDRRLETRQLLSRIRTVLSQTRPSSSPRLAALLARADGVLADPDSPDAYPDNVLGNPDGDQWPFERARLRLEYGEWLRRRRRINDAKTVLGEAFKVFNALKAVPWAHRAETELRACGIALTSDPITADGLDELTAQQREIIGLAARGLSNREIGERLFLSPRTVASHLYRSFPKLGVASRHQLRDLLAQAGAEEQSQC
jgi:DNA-binding CsgD family transcriptional regulator